LGRASGRERAIPWNGRERKSAKADQEGLACIGLGGLWSWLLHGQPTEALDTVEWYAREVLLAPDARVWGKPKLLFAVYAFGQELKSRGATVHVLKLPLGPEGAEVGLDDYLCAHPEDGVAQIETLPHLALDKPPLDRFKARWRAWHKRKDADVDGAAGTAGTAPSGVEIIAASAATRALHPAQDVVDGVLVYGYQPAFDAPLVLVTSRRQAARIDQLPRDWRLRHEPPGAGRPLEGRGTPVARR
jgi:hypothetical protein